MSRVYLAGPMSGLPDFNYPTFLAEAERLRALGYQVENPAEINPVGGDWDECMRRDIARLVLCDTIALLPGWAESRGATLERYIAKQLSLKVVDARRLSKTLHQPTPPAPLEAAHAER